MPTLRLAIESSRAKRGAAEFDGAVKRKVIGSAKQAERAVGRVDRSMDRLGLTAASVGRKLTGFFGGLAALAGIRAAARTIANFEETLATVRGVTGATEEQFQQLAETAARFGAITRFSASEAAEGLLFLARAGFEVQEAIAALPATLNLAIAGQLELGEAADFASNILSQFNIEAARTVEVVDTLVKTANSSNTNVRQLAEAMKFAGPIAGSLGRTVQEAAAAIGVLGDSGIQASLAGTNLRGVMLNLAGPTGAAADRLQALGIALEDVSPERHNLVSIFKRLAAAQLSAADATDIFGRRNAAAAIILSQNVGKLQELEDANLRAAGTAQKLADIQNQTLAGSFRNLRSSIEALTISAGDSGLLFVLKGITDTATGVIRLLSGMNAEMAQASLVAQALAFAAKAAGIAIALLIGRAVIRGFIALSASIQGLVHSMRAAAIAGTALKVSLTTAQFALIATGIGLAAVAVYELIAALATGATESEKFTSAMSALNDELAIQRDLQFELSKARAVDDFDRQLRALERLGGSYQEQAAGLRVAAEEVSKFGLTLDTLSEKTGRPIEELRKIPVIAQEIAARLEAARKSQAFTFGDVVGQVERNIGSIKVDKNVVRTVFGQIAKDILDEAKRTQERVKAIKIELGLDVVTPGLSKDVKALFRTIRDQIETTRAEAITIETQVNLGVDDESNRQLKEQIALARVADIETRAFNQRLADQEKEVSALDDAYDKAQTRLVEFFKLALQQPQSDEGLKRVKQLTEDVRLTQAAASENRDRARALKEETAALREQGPQVARAQEQLRGLFDEQRAQNERVEAAKIDLARVPIIKPLVDAFKAAFADISGNAESAANTVRAGLGGALDFVTDLARKVAGARGVFERSVKRDADTLRAQNTALKEAAAAAKDAESAQRDMKIVLEAVTILREKNIPITSATIEQTKELAAEVLKLREENEKLTKSVEGKDASDQRVIGIKEELKWLRATYEQRLDILALEEASRLGIAASDTAAIEKIKEEFRERDQLIQQLENLRRVSAFAEDAASSFLESIIVDGAKARDVLGSLAKDFSRFALRFAVSNAFTQLGLRPTAKGDAFDQGRVVPFQFGGVIDRPTVFPIAGSKLGLAGEAGPEGVLPLGRDSQGRLGVRMIGATGGGTVVHMSFPNVRSKQDARGFRTTVTQAMEDIESRGRRNRLGV